MKFEAPDYVVLVVERLDRALEFYCDTLGIALGHRSDPYAQLDTGRTRLAFYERSAMSEALGFDLHRASPEAAGFELGFKVDDCDAAFSELVESGAEAVTEPTTRPWGQRTAYVRDPDGHLVELAQDLD